MAASAGAPLAIQAAAQSKSSVPIGIELYSVRQALKNDLMGTVAAVARMGYQAVEFYSPYFDWTPAYAKEVRKHLDDLGIECRSMHSPARTFEPENSDKAIELNGIVGSSSIVMASPGRRVDTADGWKRVAETLTAAQERFHSAGMSAGYHNHATEWADTGAGKTGMDILAAETTNGVTLQLDIGTCVEMGKDPVTWIRANPGRIRSMHCKDWEPGSEEDDKGFRVLFGEGAARWPEILSAAESVGGVEFYLIEQEGSRYSEMETAERCLEAWRRLRQG